MPQDVDHFLRRAHEGKRELKYLEFKERFDPDSEPEWIELIKDLVAIANSGGGVVVIGVKNDAKPSRANVDAVLRLDGAKIADKLVRYVGDNFDDFEVHEIRRANRKCAALIIGPAVEAPLVFVREGKYNDSQGKAKQAFARGAPYFRHGAKSEPGTSADLRAFIERRLDRIRETWLGGIRRVVEASGGSEIVAIQRTEDAKGETRIRITTDEDAPVYGRVSADDTHPYRQTELIDEVNRKLPEKTTVNAYDVLSVRRAHGIDEKTQPDFVHLPKFGAQQYSDAFVDWLVEQHRQDGQFFSKARDAYYRLQRP